MTLKAVKILGGCEVVFVPKSGKLTESTALRIAGGFLKPGAKVMELEFPMSTDQSVLQERWDKAAATVAKELEKGGDACFLTLGDISLYSTFHYLLKSLIRKMPDVPVELIPGVTSYSAAAARSLFCLGEGEENLALIPSVGNLKDAEKIVDEIDTIVFMKIGKNLGKVLNFLEAKGRLATSVLASRVGHKEERIVRDLASLRGADEKEAYLSVILSRRSPSSPAKTPSPKIEKRSPAGQKPLSPPGRGRVRGQL
jgi:precorrin-2/cobalt-factor-2 C20-methyltransferase